MHRTFSNSIESKLASHTIRVALTICALGVPLSLAHAGEYDEITVSAPTVKVVGHDVATGAPITQVTVIARIQYDPVTLTTNSGVALLKDGVLDAARKLCRTDNPQMVDESCVRSAVESAQTQVDTAIARARTNAHG